MSENECKLNLRCRNASWQGHDEFSGNDAAKVVIQKRLFDQVVAIIVSYDSPAHDTKPVNE
jgi:hypothetical protein